MKLDDTRALATYRDLFLRRTGEARAHYDRGLEIAAANIDLIHQKAMTYLQDVEQSPDHAVTHAFLGLSLAYLGRHEEAVREAEIGARIWPPEKNALSGPYILHQLARIHLLGGDKAKALDLLERILRMPYYLTPAWLRVDPTFAPLTGEPRFETIARG